MGNVFGKSGGQIAGPKCYGTTNSLFVSSAKVRRKYSPRTRAAVLKAVRKDRYALKSASPREQADREVVLAAINHAPRALHYASAELRNDRELVLLAVQRDGLMLGSASPALQADKQLVLAAVAQDGRALVHAHQALWQDRDVVLVAVAQHGMTLQTVDTSFRSDMEVVMAAARQNGLVLRVAGGELCNNKNVVLAAVAQNGWALRYASARLREDRDVLLRALDHDGYVLELASETVRADREIVMAAVRQDGCALQHASPKLRADREVVLAAVSQKGERALGFAAQHLHVDEKVLALLLAMEDPVQRAAITVGVRRGATAAQVLDVVRRNLELPLTLTELDGTEYLVTGWLDEVADLCEQACEQHAELGGAGPFDIVDDEGMVLDKAGVAAATPMLLSSEGGACLMLVWCDDMQQEPGVMQIDRVEKAASSC